MSPWPSEKKKGGRICRWIFFIAPFPSIVIVISIFLSRVGGHVYSARVAVGSDAYSGSSIIGRYDVESDTAFL